MTKINTIDMVYHVPYNHTLLPTNTGTLNNVIQPSNPTYLNSSNINTAITQLVYTNNNKRYFDFNGTSRAIRSTATVSYTKYSNIQFDCDFILRTKKRHVMYCVGTGGTTANETISVFEVYINNATNKIVVELGSKSFTTDYKFDINVEYNILVTVSMDRGLLVNINGESVSNFDYALSKSAFMSVASGSYYHIIGNNISSGSTSNPNVGLDGYMTNVYSSFGGMFIHRDHTDYTSNPYNKLLQFNMLNDGIDTTVDNNSKYDIVNKVGVDFNYTKEKAGFYKVDSPVWFGIENAYYVKFGLGVNNSLDDVLLFSNNQYEVRLSGTYSDLNPEPKVVVNAYTKSALNFENGIIDQVGTTVWNKEGTATVQSTNKIFGENSFETKALGDSLYTDSNIITGGSTPFTIEFYALIKGRDLTQTRDQTHHLFNKNNNVGGGDQIFHVSKDYNIAFQYYNGSWVSVEGTNDKIRYNEINKYSLSYDGSCIRGFVNDILGFSLGRSIGLLSNVTEPYRFMRSYIPNYSSNSNTTFGLIDNINIFDGIATKVRNPDPYEEFLVVDLAFDGENNSTKIVDNGVLKSAWSNEGFTTQPVIKNANSFDNNYALYLNGRQNIKNDQVIIFEEYEDFTISFEFLREYSTQQYVVALSTYTNDYSNAANVYSLNVFNQSYPNVSASYLKNKISFISEKELNINTRAYSLISNTDIVDNVKYKVDVIRKNGTCSLYVNNKFETSTNDFNKVINLGKLCIGHPLWSQLGSAYVGHIGYIKNFKIYKGVAVIPESPVGKIQLDFDNNVTDKYNNSTWTNNGVTFDQVNSVKGYAAYFNGGSSKLVANTELLNFGSNDFNIEYDIKLTDITDGSRYVITTNSYYGNSGSIWNAASSYLGFDYVDKPINSSAINLNSISNSSYYNQSITRKNKIIFVKYNDVVLGLHNLSNEIFNYNIGNQCTMGASTNFGIGTAFNGYIDNFKSIKDYQESVIIDKPAVHLPLETNAINTGFTPLTINSVGSPTYTTIDGKKCIKFEDGKYLIINSNNIFNLGASSDFYMEFDFYINTHKNYNFLLCNDNGYTNQLLTMIFINDLGQLKLRLINDNDIYTSNTLSLNTFHNFKIYRKNSSTFISLNNFIIQIINFNYNLSINGVFLGTSGWNNSSDYLNGYMSNFKMFVGTSEIPETYNDKKVLDLDFKPTGKSYLFKDNNNKCVIHPVNITQRDYQNSQYCCTFNGTNQHLQLGKNDLLNFGNDDFVINVKFNSTSTTGWRMIMCDNASSTNFIDIDADYKLLAIKLGGSRYDTPPNSIMPNTVYNVIIQVINSILTVKINDIQSTLDRLPSQIVSNVNFNLSSNTFIGSYLGTSEYFQGQIYSIKVLRNTSDLSLIVDIPQQTSTFEYKLVNTETLDEQLITTINNKPDIEIERNNTNVMLSVDNQAVSIPSDPTIIDGSSVELFTEYNDTIKADLVVYDQKPTTASTYVIPELDYSPIEVMDVDGIDSIDVIQYQDAGDYVVDGFTEGYPDAKFKIINRTTNEILTYGVDSYYHGGINPVYIKNYYVYLYELGIEYPLEDHKMEKGSITYYLNTTLNACVGADYRVRLLRRMDGRIIGEYQFTDGFCSISNLDKSVAYDAILFDKTNQYESVVMSNRYPLAN